MRTVKVSLLAASTLMERKPSATSAKSQRQLADVAPAAREQLHPKGSIHGEIEKQRKQAYAQGIIQKA